MTIKRRSRVESRERTDEREDVNDGEGTAAAAHALKSMSLYIGAAAPAALIERGAREGKTVAPADLDRLSSLAEETFALLGANAA